MQSGYCLKLLAYILINYLFTVRLYKCESFRPDCSRCVSEVTTQEELGCVWCDGICAVNDSAVCLMTNSMVTRDNGLNCPDPVIEEVDSIKICNNYGFGNCQRPVFSLGVSQHLHKITNL